MDLENLSEEENSDHNIFSDADNTYPSGDSDSDSEVDPDLPEVAIAEVEPEPGPWKEYKKHPGKKRLRRQENWVRKKAKMARNGGKSYTDRKGTIHPAKRLKEYNHNCRYKRNINMSEEKCKSIKIQSLGLSEEYRTNEDVKLHVNMFAALAFLKPEDVRDGWLQVLEEAPDHSNPKLSEFFDYFIETWLENDQIPIEMWNCNGKRHRTTNAVEGWHNKIVIRNDETYLS